MVTTRRMAALTDPTSPPSASFDTVVPHSAATARLPSPMQREHDKDRETKSRRIVNISDILASVCVVVFRRYTICRDVLVISLTIELVHKIMRGALAHLVRMCA